jgi:hypothetical protein
MQSTIRFEENILSDPRIDIELNHKIVNCSALNASNMTGV